MWERIREIPGFINGVLALVVTLAVGATAAINYFATQSEFKVARCENKVEINALSIQTLNIGLEIRYLDLRRDLLLHQAAVAEAGESTNLNLKIKEIEEKMREIRKMQSENDKKISDLKEEYEKCRE